MTPEQRIAAINDLIDRFERSTTGVESELLERIAESASRLLADPSYLATVLRDWRPTWVALIQALTTGILSVSDLTTQYFQAMDIDPIDIDAGRRDLLLAIGITAAGVVVEGGYLSQLLNDTSVGRQMASVITDAKLRSLEEGGLLTKLKPLIRGKGSRGIVGRLFDSLPTQPYVEADRIVQTAVAIRAKLKASLYLGGLIDSSRPFCKVRNGKVFLDEEVARFGTSKDQYGGYVEKKTGYFSGKPKVGYDPFTMCGGVKCRHHRSYISNAEAMRRRDDLVEVNGVLRIRK